MLKLLCTYDTNMIQQRNIKPTTYATIHQKKDKINANFDIK